MNSVNNCDAEETVGTSSALYVLYNALSNNAVSAGEASTLRYSSSSNTRTVESSDGCCTFQAQSMLKIDYFGCQYQLQENVLFF